MTELPLDASVSFPEALAEAARLTDSLLERETQLSPKGREQLQIIQRAVEDVAATVARIP